MVTITLDENYKLEASEFQWILRYEKIGEINQKTNKPTISKNETFHNTLQNALVSYCDKKLKNSENISEGLTKLMSEIDVLITKINEIKIK